MSAYVIGDINVTNPETYAEYAAAVPSSSEAFGGKYLVRGPDKCQPAEGEWYPQRFVLAEYKELTKLRQSASAGSLLVAQGVEPHAHSSGTGRTAYLVGDIEVTDPERYSTYASGVPQTVAAYGGQYLVRGVSGEVLEGSWDPKLSLIHI